MKKVVILILSVLLMTANLSAYVGSAKSLESAAQVVKFLESLSKQGKGGETVAKGLFQEFKTLGMVFKSTTVNGMIKELGTNPQKAKIARAHLLTIEGLNESSTGEITSFIRSPEERMDVMVNSMISRISQKVDGEFSALCNGKIKDPNGFAPIARDLAELKGVNLNNNLQAAITSSKINMGITEVINLLKQERMLTIKISQSTSKDSAKNFTDALNKLINKKKIIPKHILDAAWRVDLQNTFAYFSKEAGLLPTRFAQFWAEQYEVAKRLLKEGFPESVKQDFAAKGINPSNYTATQLTNELMSGLWQYGSLFMDAEKAYGGMPTVNQIKELAKVVGEPGFDKNLAAFKGFFDTILKPGGNKKLTAQDRENIFSCIWAPGPIGVAVR